jgi:regulator of replication initiation timing
MSRKHDDWRAEMDRQTKDKGPTPSPETGPATPAPATTSMPGHPGEPPLGVMYRIAELEEVLSKHEQADRQNLARIVELEAQVKHLEGQHKLEMLDRDRREAKLREDNDALIAENALFRDSLGKRSAEEEAEAAEEAAKGEDTEGDQGNAIVAEVMRADGAALGDPMYLAKGRGVLWTNDLRQARRFRNGRDFN